MVGKVLNRLISIVISMSRKPIGFSRERASRMLVGNEDTYLLTGSGCERISRLDMKIFSPVMFKRSKPSARDLHR
ncbi:MAG: hypothetical protein Q6352_007430 [Candidatus Freyrarchaeum guaymaensis]|nr:hypothetical protein [Candidatus Sigynarchaeota archaeon]